MVIGSDGIGGAPSEGARPGLAGILKADRAGLLGQWERESRSALGAWAPKLLDSVEGVAERASRGERDLLLPPEAPREHARHRLDQSVSLFQLAQEYALLRRIMLVRIGAHGAELTHGELILLNAWLDEAVAQAVDEYSRRAAPGPEGESLRWPSVLDQVPIGVLVADPVAERTVYENVRLAQMLGGALAPARAVAELWADQGPGAGRAPAALDEWPIARGIRGQVIDGQEVELKRPDGSRGTFLFSARPVRDRHGRVGCAVCTVVDISERGLKEAEVLAQAELERQLIPIVSHDLRNPIHAILIGAKAVLRRNVVDERAREGTARILSAAERAERLIRDLLDFTRARLGGSVPIEVAERDLHALARQTFEELRAAHPDREILLRQEGDGSCRFDWDRMAQVVVNLVGNALQHGARGAPVFLETRGEPGAVRLSVWNDGPPIPGNLVSRLFEPMRQLALTREMGKVKLGLFIVKSIVEAHGGAVSVDSDARRGTTFSVWLPRA